MAPEKEIESPKQAAAPAAAASAAPAEPSKNAKIIDAWFVETIHGSIVARDTEVYNHVFKSVADLKTRLG